jgi:DNA-binding beta-propeller fold protein YncE
MRSAIFVMVLVACGNNAPSHLPSDGGPPFDVGSGSGSGSGCGRTLAPDGARHVVVSKPYTAASDPATLYEVLPMAATGEVTRPATPVTFSMHRASFGSIHFTPDGKIGLVPQEDGTLGVFALAADGTPSVIDAGFGMGMFYAGRVVVDPSGDFAFVVDGNTSANGGGIYALRIGCDGTPSLLGKLAAASTPNGLILDGSRAFVATGQSVLDAPAGHEAVMLHWAGAMSPPTVDASSDAFGDDNAIVGGFALSADKKTLFIGDTSAFSGVPNRVGVVSVGTDAMGNGMLAPATVLTPIADPEAIATSPFGNVAIVTSTADGDAIYVLDDGGTNHAWQIRGKVAYTGAGPMLPGDVATIDRGALQGHVLVAELSSIRHLAFHDDGSVVDLGSLQFGDGVDQILGAIGVTP